MKDFKELYAQKETLKSQIIESIESRFKNSNVQSVRLDIQPNDQDPIREIKYSDECLILELDDFPYPIQKEGNINTLLEILYQVEQAIPLNHKGKFPNELVDYKTPVTEAFFDYLLSSDETKLAYDLEQIQSRAIFEIGDGTIWFKFSEDDTLATDIEDIRKTHHAGTYGLDNLNFLRERIRSAVSLEGELFVYFDKHQNNDTHN